MVSLIQLRADKPKLCFVRLSIICRWSRLVRPASKKCPISCAQPLFRRLDPTITSCSCHRTVHQTPRVAMLKDKRRMSDRHFATLWVRESQSIDRQLVWGMDSGDRLSWACVVAHARNLSQAENVTGPLAEPYALTFHMPWQITSLRPIHRGLRSHQASQRHRHSVFEAPSPGCPLHNRTASWQQDCEHPPSVGRRLTAAGSLDPRAALGSRRHQWQDALGAWATIPHNSQILHVHAARAMPGQAGACRECVRYWSLTRMWPAAECRVGRSRVAVGEVGWTWSAGQALGSSCRRSNQLATLSALATPSSWERMPYLCPPFPWVRI